MFDSMMKNRVNEQANSVKALARSYFEVLMPGLILWMLLAEYDDAAFFALMTVMFALPVSLLAYGYTARPRTRLAQLAVLAGWWLAVFDLAVYARLIL